MPHGETSTSTHTTGEGSPAPAERTDAHRVATDKCERALELFRHGKVTRGQAIVAFSKNLSDPVLNLSTQAIDSALESYLSHLDEFSRESALPEGPTGVPAVGGEREDNRQGEAPDAAEALQVDRQPGQQEEEASPQRPHRKRSRLESNVVESPDGSDSEDEFDSARKRRADTSLYAWSKTNLDAFSSSLSPELQVTFELQWNYAEDPKQALVHVLNCPGVPEFPSSEWLNVFKGNPVDLNHVLTGRYSLTWDEKQVEQLGDFKISHHTLVPTKPVQTAGDWVIAWQQTTTAVAFAFPHRREGLVKYNEYILVLFAAINPTLHHRVLDFDRAVRKRVAAARHIRLTNFETFTDLHLRFIESAGAGVPAEQRKLFPRSSRAGRATGRRARDRDHDPNEVCRRFNAGIDHGPAGDCAYRHACLTCGSLGHPKSECPKTKARPA